MDLDRLKQIAKSASSSGGQRRKKPQARKTAGVDDKKLQNTLKRLGVNQIPGIEEVNIFSGEDVVHFTNPRVQASIHANTYVVSGSSQNRKMSDLVTNMPNFLNQLGPDSLPLLKKAAEQAGIPTGDDDMPDIGSFEDASK